MRELYVPATMGADPVDWEFVKHRTASRPDKQIKWEYRRTLFQEGLAKDEAIDVIDTAAFPTLATYTASRA